jgi:tetratricopeptide (TPR) repeat protein
MFWIFKPSPSGAGALSGRKKCYLLLLLVLWGTCLSAQPYDVRLEDASFSRTIYPRPDSVFLALKEQYNKAVQSEHVRDQGLMLDKMGAICFHMGHYAQALEYYLQANKLWQQQKEEDRLAFNCVDLGILYYYSRDTAAAAQSFHRALVLFRSGQNHKGIGLTYGNIGFLWEKEGRYDSAFAYQQRALNEYALAGNATGMAKIYENIGSIYEDLARYDSAMYHFHQALALYERSGEKILQIEVLNNIGDIYRKTGRYQEAMQYTRRAVLQSSQVDELYQLSAGYRDIAKTYNLLGRDDSAFYYLDLSRKYLLDIYSRESSVQMAFLQAQNDAQKKNREIEQLHNAHRINMIITISVIVIIVLLVVLGAVIFNRQKLKARNERSHAEQHQHILETRNQLMQADLRARQLEEENLKAQLTGQQLEKEKLDTELKNKDLEEALLKEQIEVKTKELSTNALHVIQKNQLLEQLRTHLETLVNDDKRDQKKQLKQLLSLINQNFNNDTYWDEFRNTFEQVHQSFFEQLKKACPDLSASDLRLVSLLKMNMSSNDIATMLGISTDSLRVSRYRLRKKLNLEQGGNLVAFLQSI